MGNQQFSQNREPDNLPAESPQLFRPAPRRVVDDTLPPEFATPAEELTPPTLPQPVSPESVRPCPRRKGCSLWCCLIVAAALGGAYYYYNHCAQLPRALSVPALKSVDRAPVQEPSAVVPVVDALALADADFERGDFAAALPHYQSKADSLSAEQHYRCAVCLHRSAESASYTQAVSLMAQVVQQYTMAAEQGHTAAALALGSCYYRGLGTTPSLPDAEKWYTVAADKDDAEAQFRLAWCLMESDEPQDAVALQWLCRAAEQGHVAACYDLAVCYLTGRGTQENTDSAVHFLQQAAVHKHPAAMRRLAFCYRDGMGVPQDTTHALELFAEAAAAGDAEAQYNYAWALHRGYGVVADPAEALRLYLLAAAHHFAPAQDALHDFPLIRALPEILVDILQKSQNYPKM